MAFRRHTIEIGSVGAILHQSNVLGRGLWPVFACFAMQSGLAAQHFNDAGEVLSAAAHIGEEGVQRLGF